MIKELCIKQTPVVAGVNLKSGQIIYEDDWLGEVIAESDNGFLYRISLRCNGEINDVVNAINDGIGKIVRIGNENYFLKEDEKGILFRTLHLCHGRMPRMRRQGKGNDISRRKRFKMKDSDYSLSIVKELFKFTEWSHKYFLWDKFYEKYMIRDSSKYGDLHFETLHDLYTYWETKIKDERQR